MNGTTTLPQTGLTLDQARSRLSGWHFAKEALSEGEREILYVAEALLRLVDDLPDSAAIPELQRILLTKPGVQSLTIYPNGIEVAGSLNDSDEMVGFVSGSYTEAQVRAVVGDEFVVMVEN